MHRPLPSSRPWLLVIAAGDRDFREYLLRSIGAAYRVHLLLGAEPTWERQHIAGCTVLDLTETYQADALIAAATAVARTEPVAGVLTWDEARILQAAKVAAALGLPGGDPEMVLRCRDKHLTRQALATAGLAQPESVLVAGVEEALAAAERIGYPVVLKPRAMAASLGVVRVDTPAEVTARFGFARDATVPGAWRYDTVVLVEELLTGPEVSVDAAVHRGEVLPVCVARKDVDYPPYFEEVGHVVDAADPLLAEPAVLTLVQETHTALGFTDGMTHTELKLTPTGPKVVEVNARLGGDLIPYLGLRATGIDPGLAAAAVACGQRPALAATQRRVAGVRFFYPDRDDTTVGAIDVDQAALPPETEVWPLVAPGTVVSPPPTGTAWGRIACAITTADSVSECRQALATAATALRVESEPAAVR